MRPGAPRSAHPPLARAFLALLALLAAGGEARADLVAGSRGLIHRVTDKGESYEDLAEFYYGKRYLSLHLRMFNGRPEPLTKGTSIIIPTYITVPSRHGQTMQQFAEANLNDPGRADYLVELHGLRGRDRTSPRAGLRLRVVESLRHVVRPGESLRSIARIYYRDVGPERLKLLMLYNKLASEAAVHSGISLRIPLDSPEFSREAVLARARRPFERGAGAVAEAPPVPVPAAPADRRPQARRRPATGGHDRADHDPQRGREETGVEAASDEGAAARSEAEPAARSADRPEDPLEAVERACDDGDFAGCEREARRRLDAPPAAAAATRVELLRLEAFALIAQGRVEESKAAFRDLLKLDPEYDLDLYRTSPKILGVFQAVAER